MLEELEVLKIVSERLESARLPFMLTGSFAMAKDSGSELQRRDVRTLLDDRAYLQRWAARLGVAEALAEIAR